MTKPRVVNKYWFFLLTALWFIKVLLIDFSLFIHCEILLKSKRGMDIDYDILANPDLLNHFAVALGSGLS